MPPQNQPYPGPGISAPLQPRTDVPMAPPPKKGMNKLIIPFVFTVLLLFSAMGFAIYAYGGMLDYKNNSDKKAKIAADAAVTKAETAKDNEFLEKEKSPTKEYKGPAALGSVTFTYPKTWSAYIDEKGDGGVPLSGYMHPNFVPAVESGTAFALRFEVTNKSLDEEVKSFDSKVKTGKIGSSPYRAPKVPSALGTRLTGEINEGQKDTMVLLPIRDKTLKVWTESEQTVGDLDKIVLASLVFVP
jgi:hypothetical protein